MLPGRWFMGEEALSFLIPLPNMTSSTFCKRLSFLEKSRSELRQSPEKRSWNLNSYSSMKNPSSFLFFFWVSKLNKTEVTFVLRRIKVYFPTSILGGEFSHQFYFWKDELVSEVFLLIWYYPTFFSPAGAKSVPVWRKWAEILSGLALSPSPSMPAGLPVQLNKAIRWFTPHINITFFLLSNVSESHRQDFSCRPFHPRLSLLFYNSKSCLETVKSGH